MTPNRRLRLRNEKSKLVFHLLNPINEKHSSEIVFATSIIGSTQVLGEEVLSGLIPQGSGLGFRQFVDALARCGLIAYTADETSRGGRVFTGQKEEIHELRRSPLPAGEAIQAIFIRHMTLLDDSRLNEKMHRHNSARRQQRRDNKEEKEDGSR